MQKIANKILTAGRQYGATQTEQQLFIGKPVLCLYEERGIWSYWLKISLCTWYVCDPENAMEARLWEKFFPAAVVGSKSPEYLQKWLLPEIRQWRMSHPTYQTVDEFPFFGWVCHEGRVQFRVARLILYQEN
jgi:hypothetical protein